MNINELIATIKNKLKAEVIIQNIKIEDKSFLHKNHKGNQEGKFHLKIMIKSNELIKLSRVDSTKKIYNILDLEMKNYIIKLVLFLKKIEFFFF